MEYERKACLSEVDELERVPDERLLDVDVDLRVSRERGRVVHLEHLGLELRGEQHVEAKDLEACRAGARLQVVRETCAVVVLERRLARDERLDDRVVDVIPQLHHVVPVLRQPPVDRRQAPVRTARDTRVHTMTYPALLLLQLLLLRVENFGII